jgi:HlyD family secretion protein
MDRPGRNWFLWAILVVVVAGIAFEGWRTFRPHGLPDGFASGNGRIEAVEVDIAAKIPGRLKEVLVDEGDFVTAGQVLARMDTDSLDAQRREAEAQLQRATIGIDIAKRQLEQREAEKAAAVAQVSARKAELDAAQGRRARSEATVGGGAVSRQTLDDDRARALSAQSAVSAAQAQVAAADAAIGLAKLQIIGAQADADSAKATIQRIQVDIDDSTLRSPRDGRVQFRVAEPGEVIAAGGRILNLVDLADVYMTFFLPTAAAGRVALGTEVHVVLDAAPQYVIPAQASYVADIAQFTPKTVETAEERQKLMFRVKARLDADLLRKYMAQVKTGLPGMAYVKLDPRAAWPENLKVRLP